MKLCLLYSEERIAAAVEKLAQQISAAYAGQELLLVVVLKGAFIFAADLVRRLELPLAVDFVQLTSYRGMESTGRVVINKDVEADVTGRHVLVVEDIVDTGLTLAFLLETLRSRGPKSLRVCTLIDKRSRRSAEVAADFVGIGCEDGFLVGYGLDLDERSRELPAIYEVDQNQPSGG